MTRIVPNSKPIQCSEPEEGLAVAYSIFRQVMHYLSQSQPSAELTTDVTSAVGNFCSAYEKRVGITKPAQSTAEFPTPTP